LRVLPACAALQVIFLAFQKKVLACAYNSNGIGTKIGYGASGQELREHS
jgi:hypothetical protein